MSGESEGEAWVLMTGAPDVLLSLCAQQQTASGAEPLDRSYRDTAITRYASEGLCTVAAAWKRVPQAVTTLEPADLRQDMVMLGLACMMDPPRPEAVAAIRNCQQAGHPRQDDHRRP
nr:carbonate dehydratase [Candidatus Pantoea persica]